jgi:phosphatidylinositol alpha-1,6-mannosyltransferase
MSGKKKILIITNDFYPSRGGIQECIMGLANSYGKSSTVLAPYYPGYTTSNDEEFSFDVRRTNSLRQDRMIDRLFFLVLRRPFSFLLRSLPEVFRIMELRETDYIICGHFTLIPIGLFLRRVLGIPIGTIIHGKELFFIGMFNSIKRMFGKFLISKSDLLFMSNTFVKEKLLEMGFKEDRVVKIPFGVNLGKRLVTSKKQRENNKKNILTVGRLVERKGHDVVIKALPLVLKKFPNVKYIIVGEGPMERGLKDLVESMVLNQSVEFCGEVKNIETFYQNCDVFVMPSRFIENKGDVEGFGLVFLEANFFEKPVIAGRSGGISDAVIDGVTGLLVNPEDSTEIANAIIKLLENHELAQKLGEQGRRRVLEEFTWEKAADVIERTMTGIKRGNKGVNRGIGETGKRRRHTAS